MPSAYSSSPFDSPPFNPSPDPSVEPPRDATHVTIPPAMTASIPTGSLSPEQLSSVLSSLASVAATEGGSMSILPIGPLRPSILTGEPGASLPFFRPGASSAVVAKRDHGPLSVEGGHVGTSVLGDGVTCVGTVLPLATGGATTIAGNATSGISSGAASEVPSGVTSTLTSNVPATSAASATGASATSATSTPSAGIGAVAKATALVGWGAGAGLVAVVLGAI